MVMTPNGDLSESDVANNFILDIIGELGLKENLKNNTSLGEINILEKLKTII